MKKSLSSKIGIISPLVIPGFIRVIIKVDLSLSPLGVLGVNQFYNKSLYVFRWSEAIYKFTHVCEFRDSLFRVFKIPVLLRSAS